MTAGDPRIVDLRAKVRDERALLAELSARVSTTLADLFTPLLRVDPASAVRTSPRD
jgi:hypothetical protein